MEHKASKILLERIAFGLEDVLGCSLAPVTSYIGKSFKILIPLTPVLEAEK